MHLQQPSLRRAGVTAAVLFMLLLGFPVPGAAQWEGDISRWKAQDKLDPPAPGAIVFTGSSSIRRWEQLALDFADYRIIQRGFGGAQFDDLNKYAADIVLPYKPAAVVVWAGTNDLASGGEGDEVFADFQQFVTTVHEAQPSVEIFYLGIMPTPGREGNRPQEDIANRQISALVYSNPKLHYVDLPTAFTQLDPYQSDAFLNQFVDSIHLSREGYEFWTSLIRPKLEAVVAPNKVFTPNPDTPQPGSRILFDFGPSNAEDGDHTLSPDSNGNYWNNWHEAEGGVPVNAGEHLGNLVDTTGAATGVNLTITGGFSMNGKLNGGLATPQESLLGDLAVASATVDYFFSAADNRQGGGNDEFPGGFMLDGLDPKLAYDFRFFASRGTRATQVTELLVTGANNKKVVIQTSGPKIGHGGAYDGNDNKVAVVAGIRPDAFGQVFVDVTLLKGDFAYIGAMEITVATP